MSKHCHGDKPALNSGGCESTSQQVEHGSSCCESTKKEDSLPNSCCAKPSKPQESSCCSVPKIQEEVTASCCAPKQSFDWIMWGSIAFVIPMYVLFVVMGSSTHDVLPETIAIMSHTSFEMMNTMWWGILLGALAVGALGRIPNQMVMAVLGVPGSRKGVIRATMAGLMLDLCNHGILMVAMGLYRKGASLGQVMAFLIASPWNSFTLTLILIALIGLPFTLLFIVCSMIIAWISGLFFDYLVKKGTLPSNPATAEVDADFKWGPAIKF